MATQVRTIDFLPEIFKTKSNEQFLAATLDQITQQPDFVKVQGFVGSKFGYGVTASDGYVNEPTKERTDYQLEPAVVFKKKDTDVAIDAIPYSGLIDSLRTEGALGLDHNKLFNNEFYSWDSFTELDKIINYSQYYWLPQGPDDIIVATNTLFNNLDFTVTNIGAAYSLNSLLQTFTENNPTITLVRGGTYTFTVSQDSEFWIQTEPGTSGVRADSPNISTREVVGVDFNGSTQGTITFTVPLSSSQNDNYYPGNLSVDLVSDKKFDEVHGKSLSELSQIDGEVNFNGKTLLFYKSTSADIGYRGTFFDEYDFDSDSPGNVEKISIEVTQTEAIGNLIHTTSTSDLAVGSDITFSGISFGGIIVGQVYYVKTVNSSTTFTIAPTFDGTVVALTNGSTDSNAPLLAEVNVGGLEEGKTTTVNDNFYKITLVGDINNPTIYLEEHSAIPNDQRIQVTNGKEYVNRVLVRNTYGEILLVPVITANLDTLYYQDGKTETQFGKINLVDGLYLSRIDVLKDILNKPNYISPNDVKFTNGIKVKFFGNVFPEEYLQDAYYVEGVGSSIQLIPVSEQLVPEPFTEGEAVPLDSDGFDVSPYSDSALVPALPDYITIGRGSKNKNGWSRSNRWFHVNALNLTLEKNSNSPLVLSAFNNSDVRAKRPIIEFYPDLKLFNSGAIGKPPVDFIDLNTTNAFTQVSGKLATTYHPDGASSFAFDGARIIFANDDDPKIKGQIFIVSLADNNSDFRFKVTLSKVVNGEVRFNDQTVITKGEYSKGLTYYFDGSNWHEAQSKKTINQPPLFDLFDSNGISYGNDEYYPGTDFSGTKLFSYAEGAGQPDPILNFPIKYSSITNIGDIVFESRLNSDTFNYVADSTSITSNINNGYVHSYDSNIDFTRLIGWRTAVEYSIQYQIFNLVYTGSSLICDIAAKDPESTKWPVITVYEDNQRITDYEYTTSATTTKITLLTPPPIGTPVEILIHSDQVSKIGYYQIPSNFDHNPFNEEISTINLGDLRGHYKSICNNLKTIEGPAFGPNNFRDLGNTVPYGTRIIQNSSSLITPAILTKASKFNFLDALLFNSNQYTKFKTSLLDMVNNNDYLSIQPASIILDDALEQITNNRDETMSFFWSDMIPCKGVHSQKTYTFNSSVDASIFPLSRFYDFTNANYFGILVYLSRIIDGTKRTIQLMKDIDYVVKNTEKLLRINTDLLPNDVIIVREYSQTYGNYVPNTPTKLGFYPSYIPEVILDDSYSKPTYFIKGHDGSLTKLFGEYNNGFLEDNRDRALLEFEKRVYNNLKVNAKIPVEYDEIIPGQFRKSDYTFDEINAIYATQFLNWAGNNNIDYTAQTYFETNEFTWNYKGTKNKLDNSYVNQGYWRGIYLWYYDTTTPHTTPWEMLGLVNKPSWWNNRYGEAPYTSDNTLLWTDISNGLIWNNGDSYVNERRIRSRLLEVLPVDSAGRLISPFVSIVNSYNSLSFKNTWNVADTGPAEYSYKKSSTWPFDLLRIFALTKPAEFFSLGINLDAYRYNTEFNQYLIFNRKRQTTSDIPVYGDGTATHSLFNWIVDYANQYGIDGHTQLVEYITNIDVRLAYRMAGFSDKSLLKFFAEKGSPNSKNNSLLIPDESFNILLTHNQPTKNIIYSSVIIQRTRKGYRVYGNDKERSYFVANDPRFDGRYENISMGSQTVSLSTHFFNSTTIYPYGYEFTSVLTLANFLNGYGKYLASVGFTFENIENGIEINWRQMIVEVLYWVDSGWEEGSVINLNPNASSLTISNSIGVVQSLTDTNNNLIFNQNQIPISLKDLAITRLGTTFTVKVLNSGDAIGFFKANISSYEHIVIFDNITVFNDILFNLKTGLRQQRLFMRGSKTAQWDGTLNAPGFIINQDNILDWEANVRYSKGSIVKYKNSYWIYLPAMSKPQSVFKPEEWNPVDYNLMQKGLLPNASTRAKESTLYYDSNTTNLKKDADLLSFSLIGYRPRNYFSEINLDDTTQVNLYKSMIVNKGTKNSLDILLGATLQETDLNYTFHDNWAIKQSEYGGKMNKNFIEVTLDEKLLVGNPSIVSITQGITEDGAHQEIQFYDIKNYSTPPKDVNFLPSISATEENLLPSAGYVNIDDIQTYAFYPGMLNSANIGDLYKNDYVWVADVAGDWKVYTPIRLGINLITVRNSLNSQAVFVFDNPHTLTENELFGVINFNPNINGYYTVIGVLSLNSISVIKNIDPSTTTLTGIGITFKLSNQRVERAKDILGLPLLNAEYVKNKVWVDKDVNGEWNVLQKTNSYTYKTASTPALSVEFGATVAAIDSGYLVADPSAGKVFYYVDSALSATDWKLSATLSQGSGFGSAIASNDKILVISQPDPFGDLSKIYIYRMVANSKINCLVEEQIISFTNTMFGTGITVGSVGTALALSGDGNYLYISATDLILDGSPTVGLFFSFQLDQGLIYYDVGYTLSSAITPGSTQFDIYGDIGTAPQGRRITFTAFGVGDDVYTIVTAKYNSSTLITTVYIYETIPYTVSTGSTMYLGVLNYSLVGAVSSEGYGGYQDKFGYSLATNHDGTRLFVGSPLADWSYGAGLVDTGFVFSFNRLVEKWEVVGDSPLNSAALFFLSWTPNYGSAVYINEVRVNPSYYVLISNLLVTFLELKSGDIITVSSGNVLLMQRLQGAGTIDEFDSFEKFGFALDCNTSATDLIVGSPNNLDSLGHEGAVFRFTNEGKRTGVITGIIQCHLLCPVDIFINGFRVSLPDPDPYQGIAGDAFYVANRINLSVVNNVFAYASEDNRLHIRLRDFNLGPVNNKLNITVFGSNYYHKDTFTGDGVTAAFTLENAPANISALTVTIDGLNIPNAVLNNDNSITIYFTLTGSVVTFVQAPWNAGEIIITWTEALAAPSTILTQLGISEYITTEVITDPRPSSRTSFGYSVKFNELNSFIVGAPTTDRYFSTSFDFTDDTNNHNDCVFDNNFTQWEDIYKNAGTAYIYEYIDSQGETLLTLGNYTYAQSLPDLSTSYGKQPYYGKSVSLRNNHAVIGAPSHRYLTGNNVGRAVAYQNLTGDKHWSVLRKSTSITDVSKIQKVQLYDNETNQTLDSLDYFDPLQGKLLGTIADNLDFITTIDPAGYNNEMFTGTIVWTANKVGTLWFDISSTKFMNYHQEDIEYNSKYWGAVFPGSIVTVYSWIESNVIPINYPGPGTPYDYSSYSMSYENDAGGNLNVHYYYWVRNTNKLFSAHGKTLTDTVIESYIKDPHGSGIDYFVALKPNVFGLYNVREYINEKTTNLHIGYSSTDVDIPIHSEFQLIRSNYTNDFLPGLPDGRNYLAPEGLYRKFIESFAGQDDFGQVLPNPGLPKLLQIGIGSRPNQTMFIDRSTALKNYLQYANRVLKNYPISELPNLNFLSLAGEDYDTTLFWDYVYWWADGYSDNVKTIFEVDAYYDLVKETVKEGTIVGVSKNSQGKREVYKFTSGVWERIGVEDGTIEFSSKLWNPVGDNIGYGDDFFDVSSFDAYPAVETKNIIRALNEQIYTGELAEHRNKSLILMFEYIQSENVNSNNYLPWLTKTSLADVSYKIRELKPYQKYQNENTNLLEGFINEIKPYHTVLKEFYFTYSGTESYEMSMTDFDLPATFSSFTSRYESPKLKYVNVNTEADIVSTDTIWSTNTEYNLWYNNFGLELESKENQQIGVVSKYLGTTSTEIFLENARGVPVTGLIKINDELIRYTQVDREQKRLYGLSRGVDNTIVTEHYPKTIVYSDSSGVVVVSSGRGYVDPPIVKAYIDTSKYPAPRKEAVLRSVLVDDKVVEVQIIDPGDGYVVTPEIIFDPAFSITFDGTQLNYQSNLLVIESDDLRTGDQIKITSNSNQFEAIQPGYYYARVLGFNTRLLTAAKPVVSLHYRYLDSISGEYKVVFKINKLNLPLSYTLAMVPKVVVKTKNSKSRQLNSKLRFDRTSYNSFIVPWESGIFWPSSFNSLGNDASSNVPISVSTEYKFDQTLATLDGTISVASSTGEGFKFSVFNQKAYGTYYVTITSPGVAFRVGDTITITGDYLGGETPENDIVITVTELTTGGVSSPINKVSFVGTPFVSSTIDVNEENIQDVVLTASLQGAVIPIVSASADSDETTIIQVNYLPSTLRPGQLKGLKAYFYRNLAPYTYNDTGANFKATVAIGSTSTFTGTISGTTLTVTTGPVGTGISIGDILTGGSIASDIYIVRNLTGTSTSTNSSWTINSSITQVTTVTFTVTPVTMTVTEVTHGKLSAGQTLYGTGVTSGTKIALPVTGTVGGTGSYKLTKAQTVSASTSIQTNGGAILEIHRPNFDPLVLINRYYLKIVDSGSIYKDGDTVIIPGDLLGGVTGTNDAVIDIVFANDVTGEIQVSKINGLSVGYIASYYIFPFSANELKVYSDVSLVKPVPFINFIYTSDGTNDFAYLPEPLLISGGYKYAITALVSYNNKVYRCLESNSDDYFDNAKWQEIVISDRELNAVDRILGYYQPTIDMPAKDLGQLLLGVTNPNPTYLGNSFAPDEVLPLDVIVKDDRFYPREVNIHAMIPIPIYDEENTLIRTEYISIGESEKESLLMVSSDGLTWGKTTLVDWSFKNLHVGDIGVTDVAFNGFVYVITTTNAKTSLLISFDKVNWVTIGEQISYDFGGFSDIGYDTVAVDSPETPLNAITSVGEKFFACGMYQIVKSDDGILWESVYTNTSRLYQNLNDIRYIESKNFEGYIAVGIGNRVTSGNETAAPVVESYGKVMYSITGNEWVESFVYFTNYELYAITASDVLIVVVGDNGEIWNSLNASNWGKISPLNYLGNPITTSLRDVIYANEIFIAVGNNGVILRSTDGYTWTDQNYPVHFTNDLWNISYDGTYFFIVGNNGAMFRSVNGLFWTDISNITVEEPLYSIKGSDFLTGYGPEEMVPGVVSDHMYMRVLTRPGGWWDNDTISQEKIYGYTGFNMVSKIDSSGITLISFADMVKNPAQLAVFSIDNTTLMGPRLYEGIDYLVNWVTKQISLLYAGNSVLIEVYEIGNGNQLARGTTDHVPIYTNSITGMSEIRLDCQYILLETPIVYHNGSRLEYITDYVVELSENNLMAIIFENEYDATVDFISYAVLADSTYTTDYNTEDHFGYSIPETEVFEYTTSTTFTLSNDLYYLGALLGGPTVATDNENNAIVELNGLRLNPADYTIDAVAGTVIIPSATSGDIIAVTSYHDTKRQYLNTDISTSIKTYAVYNVDTTSYNKVNIVFENITGLVSGDLVVLDGFLGSTQLNNVQVYVKAETPFVEDTITYYPFSLYFESTFLTAIRSELVTKYVGRGFATKVSDLIDITVSFVNLISTSENFYVVPTDENRTWVTVNGNRLSSDQIRFIPGENATKLNLLVEVNLGDVVIATTMVPGATPNSNSYILNVNKHKEASVNQSEIKQSTWIVPAVRPAGGSPDFLVSDDVIYLNNVSNVVYEDTKILEINGEKIRFTTVDFEANTVSGLTRGIEGTGQKLIHKVNDIVFSISKATTLVNEQYNKLWYNKQSGDPIQLSDTVATRFLNIGLE